MIWQKKGMVFEPAGQFGWMNSHAQVPTTLILPDRLRVYFATRPKRDLSLIAFVDLDRGDPCRILSVSPTPVLDVGKPGTFDADGVMPASVVRRGERLLLYYSGWSRLAGRAPYNNATGVAESLDGGLTFRRLYDGPILDRTTEEPWSATSPLVLHDDGRWLMWYSSGTDWIEVSGKLEHVYVLKSASSEDGLHWTRHNRAILPVRLRHESQTRPTVVRMDKRWHMWFCYRGSIDFRTVGEAYRMGYAWSDDLRDWTRQDDAAGIDVSADGWDAQMICYPDIVTVDGRTVMFYNGNGFGERGFGYAALVGSGN